VTLGGKMNDGLRLVSVKTPAYHFAIADIAFQEDVSRTGKDALEIPGIPSVSQFIQVYDSTSFALHPMQDEI
jgi:hypothetical protein